MPEGDSIHVLATRLARVAVGKKVLAFSAHTIADDVAETLVGQTIVKTESRGKNLLVFFEDGRALHVHLRMLGRIRVVDAATTARRAAVRGTPRTPPQLSISLGDVIIVGSRIPVLRLLRAGGAERAPDLRTLGPDLLAPDFDEAEALSRLRALGDREIGDALMMQRALAGIGNVYKSEVLFIEKVNPRALVAELEDATLLALIRRARKLLLANVKGGPRVTRSTIGAPHYVYGRARKACFRCKNAIAIFYQGEAPGRSTYYCAKCQSALPVTARFSPLR